MSRNFLPYPVRALQGAQPFSRGINLCGGFAVPIAINWSDYGVSSAVPNMGVIINLQAQASSQIAAGFKINAVYIDNLGSNVPVYIVFTDTNFTVAASANTACWYPAVTGQLQAIVYGLGFVTGFIPVTRLFFTDVLIQPYSDLEVAKVLPQYLGSPTIQRTDTLTPGFGSPSLGDQFISGSISATQASVLPLQSIVLPAAVPATDFYYITAIAIYMGRFTADFAVSGFFSCNLFLKDLTNNVTIFQWSEYVNVPGTAESGNAPHQVLNISGLNFRLLGSHNYGLEISGASVPGGLVGWFVNATCTIGFTQNPN